MLHKRLIVYIIAVLIATSATWAQVRQTVEQYCSSFTAWADSRSTTEVLAMEELLSVAPAFRVANGLMDMLADKYTVPKCADYQWGTYIPCLQKEIDKGIHVTYAGIRSIPESEVEYAYPGVEYVACTLKVEGNISAYFHELFILKNNKIAQINKYVEKVDEATGEKKVEVNYFVLAQAAFADGDYQKCRELYKKHVLKTFKKRDYIVSAYDVFPYIESCVALNDWDGAMNGFTYIMSRKYWVNGKQWTLTPNDIKTWNKGKAPLMDILLKKTYNYYSHNADGFVKSPLMNHMRRITGISVNRSISDVADYFWHSLNGYSEGIALMAAAEYGHRDAQRNLGKWFLTGRTFQCDTIKALQWLDRAAMQGDVESAKIAAGIYLNHRNNTAKTFNYYSSMLAESDPDIHYGLGVCLYYGIGTTQNPQAAMKHLSMAEAWHPEASFLMANYYYSQADPRAVRLFRKAMLKNELPGGLIHESMVALAMCHRDGRCGAEVDTAEADRLLIEARRFPHIDDRSIKQYILSPTLIEIVNEL